MSKGLRVAPTGKDVQKTSIKDLLYTTEAKSLKVKEYGTLTIAFTTSTTLTVSVTHNTVNYIPAYRVYVEVVPGSGQWFADGHLPGGITASTDPTQAAIFDTQISSTVLQVIIGGLAGYTYKARYFIFEDSLT